MATNYDFSNLDDDDFAYDELDALADAMDDDFFAVKFEGENYEVGEDGWLDSAFEDRFDLDNLGGSTF